MTTAAVLLAAGGGTRFRADDHNLVTVLRDRPVYQHALAAAIAAGLDEVVVVVGAVALELPKGVTVVRNEQWADGQATSVQAAVRHATGAGHDAVVIGLADQPFIAPEAWRTVAATDGPIVVATYDGRRGNPVRLHRDVWPLLATSGDEGARTLMRSHPDLVREVACPGDPADIDTVEDLQRWNS